MGMSQVDHSPLHSDINAIRLIGYLIPFSIEAGGWKWQLAWARLATSEMSAWDFVDANQFGWRGALTGLDTNIADF
jgi:hypothetical protein